MKLPTSTKEQSKDFEPVHIPESIYIAELKEVKDVSDGEYGQRVAFVYNIVEQNVDLALVCYKTNATENNKLGRTLIAHGQKIDNQEIDTEIIIGTKVRAWVEDYKREFELNGHKKEVISSIITKVKVLEEKPEPITQKQ